MSLEKPHSPETAWPVSVLNKQVKAWIERLGTVWVEGQLTQVNVKRSWKLSYLTLRDSGVEASVQLTCPTGLLVDSPSPIKDGDRVVVRGKPAFYEGRGSFSLWVTDIRHVGIGELLAKIEQLRAELAAQGLFDPSRKKPIPYLPVKIGLITGRGSAAERDVLSVAQSRWPEVLFEIRNTAVQGPNAAPEVIAALRELDADGDVDVIIIARGGGSVEDLLPFSEKSLQLAVAACHTPVVSAIGHEPDNPVLDNTADLRAATPTDAAKRVVPDVVAERQLLLDLRHRLSVALRAWVDTQEQHLAALRSRPVLADPYTPITQRATEIEQLATRMRQRVHFVLAHAEQETQSLRSRVGALGPAATLARGYAIVQALPRDKSPAEVVTSITQTPPATQLRIRVADGSITAATIAATPAN